jgi:predicted nucleotidyltransferase
VYLSEVQISKLKNFLIGKPIKEASLIGDCANDEEDENGRIDLLIESDEGFDFLQFHVEVDKLGEEMKKKILIVSKRALREDRLSTKYILEERIIIYKKKDETVVQ